MYRPTEGGRPLQKVAPEPRDVLERGEGGSEGGGWGVRLPPPPPYSQGPPMVPAEGGPKIFERKSSWHRRHRSKTLAVSLKHWKGGLGRGTGGPGGGAAPSPPAVYGPSLTSLPEPLPLADGASGGTGGIAPAVSHALVDRPARSCPCAAAEMPSPPPQAHGPAHLQRAAASGVRPVPVGRATREAERHPRPWPPQRGPAPAEECSTGGRTQVNKALHTCTSWGAYAAMWRQFQK